ncbi:hypothetical protein KSP39_PZI002872 [Platanthera zijinensis]|uniref:Integrase catalytic domain-containing protein n=1 Tax=Platanthera zijinensis TaxID=2320716 RepID=A0AAP0BXM7_9ASPA
MVEGLPRLEGEPTTCEGCIMGKSHRQSFPKATNWKAKEPLELVHADLWGPATTPSIGGMKYFLCLTDDFSRFSWIYFLQHKSETFTKFREFKAAAEKQSGHNLKCLRSDGGGEFTSLEFQDYCKDQGITRELTAPYSPEQNDTAERKNRTIMEKVKAMLHHHGLPQELWAEAAQTAVYVLNRSPTRSLEEGTPYEAWRKKKPNVQHLRTFGCVAYKHIPKEGRKKLEMKAEKGIFIGYSQQSKAYRIYNPKTQKLSITRDVIFNENTSWDWDQNPENPHLHTEVTEEQPSQPVEGINLHELLPHTAEPEELRQPEPISESEEESSHPRFRSLAEIYQIEEDIALLIKEEPEDYATAAADPKWRKAMEEEIEMVEKNDTWQLVQKPKDKHILNLKWVYKAKQNEEGEIVKYKARIVAKGYTQRQGIDFHETFAPVVRMESIRAFLAIAAQAKLGVHQLDVKSAFLNGRVEEEIYVHQPEGFEKEGEEEKVYKLNKALYGLKQTPRAWNQRIDSHLAGNGFSRSKNEPSLYTKRFDTNHFLILCLYVDDLIFIGSTSEIVKEFKQVMMSEFEMSDLGLMKFFLGFQINQNPGRIFINQRKYIEQVIEKYGMKDCNPAPTPMTTRAKLVKNEEPTSIIEAEYVAVCAAACEGVWLRRLLSDLRLKKEEKEIKIWCDNTAAIGIAKNPIFHSRTKHIDLRYHFLKDLVEENQIELAYCQSNKQLADIFTKPLPVQTFMDLRKFLVSALRGGVEVLNARDKEKKSNSQLRFPSTTTTGKKEKQPKL